MAWVIRSKPDRGRTAYLQRTYQPGHIRSGPEHEHAAIFATPGDAAAYFHAKFESEIFEPSCGWEIAPLDSAPAEVA